MSCQAINQTHNEECIQTGNQMCPTSVQDILFSVGIDDINLGALCVGHFVTTLLSNYKEKGDALKPCLIHKRRSLRRASTHVAFESKRLIS